MSKSIGKDDLETAYYKKKSKINFYSIDRNVTKIIFRSLCLTPMVQTAERGSWPSVMCATETNLDQRALYGPTGRMEWIGPIGKGKLEPYAYDKDVMSKLWLLSEQKTGLTWQI